MMFAPREYFREFENKKDALEIDTLIGKIGRWFQANSTPSYLRPDCLISIFAVGDASGPAHSYQFTATPKIGPRCEHILPLQLLLVPENPIVLEDFGEDPADPLGLGKFRHVRDNVVYCMDYPEDEVCEGKIISIVNLVLDLYLEVPMGKGRHRCDSRLYRSPLCTFSHDIHTLHTTLKSDRYLDVRLDISNTTEEFLKRANSSTTPYCPLFSQGKKTYSSSDLVDHISHSEGPYR